MGTFAVFEERVLKILSMSKHDYFKGLTKNKDFVMKPTTDTANIIRNKPIKPLWFKVSPHKNQLINNTHKIITYSKGATEAGEPMLYALNKQKNPITPITPIAPIALWPLQPL